MTEMNEKTIAKNYSAMAQPKKKWLKPDKSPNKSPAIYEDEIQSLTDSFLLGEHLYYIRLPDQFYEWLLRWAPQSIKSYIIWMFGGRCDNTVIYPIGKGLALTLLLELKTEDKKGRTVGETHGKQKKNENDWIICRNIDQVKRVVRRFKEVAKEVKEFIDNGER